MVGAASWLINETTVITKKNSNETQKRLSQKKRLHSELEFK